MWDFHFPYLSFSSTYLVSRCSIPSHWTITSSSGGTAGNCITYFFFSGHITLFFNIRPTQLLRRSGNGKKPKPQLRLANRLWRSVEFNSAAQGRTTSRVCSFPLETDVQQQQQSNAPHWRMTEQRRRIRPDVQHRRHRLLLVTKQRAPCALLAFWCNNRAEGKSSRGRRGRVVCELWMNMIPSSAGSVQFHVQWEFKQPSPSPPPLLSFFLMDGRTSPFDCSIRWRDGRWNYWDWRCWMIFWPTAENCRSGTKCITERNLLRYAVSFLRWVPWASHVQFFTLIHITSLS